jgi:hypothetical protein
VHSEQRVVLSLSYVPGPAKWYRNIREFLQNQIRHAGKEQAHIAAAMDLSPSDLSRKLAENEGDCRRLTTADVERYMEAELDFTPIYYWIEKYLAPRNEEEIRQKIRELQALLEDETPPHKRGRR